MSTTIVITTTNGTRSMSLTLTATVGAPGSAVQGRAVQAEGCHALGRLMGFPAAVKLAKCSVAAPVY